MKKKYVKVFTRVCYFSLIDFLISHNVEYLLYMDVTPIHRYPYSQIPPIHRFHLYTYTDTPNTQIPLYMDVTPIHRYPYTQIPPIHRFHLYPYTWIPHIHRYLIYTDTSYTQIPHIHRYPRAVMNCPLCIDPSTMSVSTIYQKKQRIDWELTV